MAPLNVLICGGGIAGPALAYLLAQSGHRITIVERFPALRAGGSQVDLRAQGIQAIRRMGLDDAVRKILVDEAGTKMLDSQGKVHARVDANKSGKGAQLMTSEYEMMRGDLVRLLYDLTKDTAHYIFNKTVDSFHENDSGVVATLSDGSSATYDLLVGADGMYSRTRRGMLPLKTADPIRHLGMYVAYFFIPRLENDDNYGKVYVIPGGRWVMTRSHNATETHVIFFIRGDSDELRSLSKAPLEQQKNYWANHFRDAIFHSDRILEGLQKTDNFYCQEMAQVRADTWHSDRVVLLGDAAHCPAPLTGMGTSTALAGAYVLAGELNRSNGDLTAALARYESTLQPFLKDVQEVNMGLWRYAMPNSQLAVTILLFIVKVVCALKIPHLAARFAPEDSGTGGWKLPDYSENVRT